MKDIWRVLQSVILFAMAASAAKAQAPYVYAAHLTYSVIYDYSHMQPACVYYILDEPDFRGNITKKPKHYKMDYRLPPPRLRNDAYTFSGYQRGHLCPSGDRDSRKDWFKDTFYTSNILPMTANTNAGAWKEVELHCRKLCLGGHVLKIACGPVWYQDRSMSNTIHELAVPTSIWKLAKCIVHPDEVEFWVIPNTNERISSNKCGHDPKELGQLIPSTIYNYITSWLLK